MTTIVVRDGVMAADSQETWDGDAGGSTKHRTAKIFEKVITYKRKKWEVLIGTAGGSYSAMMFVDWYDGTPKPPPEFFFHMTLDEDFDCVVLHPSGLFVTNRFCRLLPVHDPFLAIGSGRKAAMGAMHMGADAHRAVQIACKIDPYSMPPIVVKKGPTRIFAK